MTNLYDGLERIAGPGVAPTPQQIEADLARGRGALRRRRLFQAGGASAFAVAAVAAAAVAFTSTGAPAADNTPLAQGSAPAAGATTPAAGPAALQLVAYTGAQPEGYTLDTVPDGWEVQGVDAYVLTLAPKNAKDKNPSSFVGKVVAMLQSVDDTAAPTGEAVTIGGNPGVIKKAGGQTSGWTVFVDQPGRPRLQVQVWDGLGWSKADAIAFTEGVHVNDNAKPGHG
jgi:hypothetical protein